MLFVYSKGQWLNGLLSKPDNT